MKWEYAHLQYAVAFVPGDVGEPEHWMAESTVWIRGKAVAKWSSRGEEDPQPLETNPAWARQPGGRALDVMGDEGWELVSSLARKTVMSVMPEAGWPATGSFPLVTEYVFKRPVP